jgi:putative ABC transport system permease protein
MNAQLVQGRDFAKELPSDQADFLINEAALKKIGYKNPLNSYLKFWDRKGKVIGVVKDFHFRSLHEPIKPLIIRLEEHEAWGNVLVRIEAGKTKQALSSLEKLWKQLNPKFPFTYQFSDEEYQKLYKSEQIIGTLSKCFAALAIFISCMGLLGLVIFTAQQRTKEIGIRKVLGASVTSLFTLLSKDFVRLVILAIVIATPVAWWAINSWLQSFEYKIEIGWWVFAIAGLIAIVIALLTVSFQAIKAAIANPVNSLRSE